MYTIGIFITIGCQLYMATKKVFFLMNTVMRAAITSAFTIRAVYFFIIASGYGLSRDTLTNFVVNVLPTSFYFTVIASILALWILLSFLENLQNFKWKLYPLFFSINLFIYLILIVFILIIRFKKENPTFDCYDRFSSISSTTQRAILEAYLIFVAVTALIACAILFFLSLRLYIKLGASGTSNFRLMLLAAIAGLSFLAHCVLYIIVATGNNAYWVAYFLLPIEIIPNVALVGLLLSSELRGVKTESKSRASTSSIKDRKLSQFNNSNNVINNDDWN